jgi:outer membrane protein OmpA-like peptidoglycan-associated protein
MKYQKSVIVTLVTMFLLYSNLFAVINTNGQKGIVRTLSAETHGQAKLDLGLGLNFLIDQDYVKGPVQSWGAADSTPTKDGLPLSGSTMDPAKLLSGNIHLGFGIFKYWDISVALPGHLDWSGANELWNGGLGDLEAATKIGQPAIRDIFFQAYYAAVTVPSGFKEFGLFPRNSYILNSSDGYDTTEAKHLYSLNRPTVKGLMLWTFDFSKRNPKARVTINLNLGGIFPLFSGYNNVMVGNFGIEYFPIEQFGFFVEVSGESRWENLSKGFSGLRRDPLIATPGIKVNTPGGVYLYLAGDFSLSSNNDADRQVWKKEMGGSTYIYSTKPRPQWGVQFGFGWNGFVSRQDADRDGIKDNEDRCPKDAEDLDEFEDKDGCPDYDNDSDGIPDSLDKCPNEAEDDDGYEDEDGCPDLDNDGDGISDVKDECPKIPEDFDGFEDKNGCPDTDNDKDGVPDSLDKCPNDAEDFDKFEDDDGCPDIDNDKDGIPDLKDKCPNKPETFNGKDDDDGCPDTKKKASNMPKHQILKGITFKSGKTELFYASYKYLDPIIKEMKEYPEIEIEVRGHTDSVGSYSTNMRLSQQRAESVRNYMISQGIESKRIKAVGFGPSSPIADNRTAEGRRMNRRIEIVRIK